VDYLAGRDLALDGIEKADEFDVAVALHATANHGAVELAGVANRVVAPCRL
jgi:hypothetical protein